MYNNICSDINQETKPKLPVYLFKKLGRYLAISTATGDFFDVTSQTYEALEKWNGKLLSFNTFPLAKAAEQIAASYNIPQEIINYFPLPQNNKIDLEDKNVKANVTDLTLNITSLCNLRCIYCWNEYGKYSHTQFQKTGVAPEGAKISNGDMSVEIARKAIDMLVDSCGDAKNLVVDFYGGEPLMNLETLRATVDYCKENEISRGVKFHFLLATNATLLTPALAEELLSRGVQIAVSIDGAKEIHDNNRPFADGKGSFNTIVSNLRKMPPEIIKRLVGRTTVTPFYPDMVELYANLRSLGFERIELFESEDACHRINPQRESIFFNTDEQYEVLYKEYERLALVYIDEIIKGVLDYRKTFFNRFFKLMQRLYYNHEVTGGCPAARGQFAVTSQGDIYPCTAFLGVERFNLGNVITGLNKEKYAAFVEGINKRFDNCSSCSLFALCRTTGSCLNMNYYFNGNPAVAYRRSCELFREKLELGVASLAILSNKIPERLEELFGFDPVGKRGNELY